MKLKHCKLHVDWLCADLSADLKKKLYYRPFKNDLVGEFLLCFMCEVYNMLCLNQCSVLSKEIIPDIHTFAAYFCTNVNQKAQVIENTIKIE